MDKTEQEASFDDTLRQAARTAVSAFAPDALLDRHQAPIFQHMNQAMLRAYLERHGKPPSPSNIQHMRGLIRMLWQDLIQEWACRREERY